jgi:hypothetical protein
MNLIMLFREKIFCENHKKNSNTLCGQNVEFSKSLYIHRTIGL